MNKYGEWLKNVMALTALCLSDQLVVQLVADLEHDYFRNLNKTTKKYPKLPLPSSLLPNKRL